MLRFVMVPVVTIFLLMSGCGPAGESTAEHAVGQPTVVQPTKEVAVTPTAIVQTSKEGETVTITGPSGESVTYSSEAPEELKTFPVPAGFKYVDGGSVTTGGTRQVGANWQGKGTIKGVVEFYQKILPGLGWKEDVAVIQDKGGMISYGKPDGSSLNLVFGQDKPDDEVGVAVMLQKISR